MFQGLSLHYYSVVDGWGYKGSATKFDEREWFETFAWTWRWTKFWRGIPLLWIVMIRKKQKVWWWMSGCNWLELNREQNESSSFSKHAERCNTAAIHLNIFNQHADRVKVANLAQWSMSFSLFILTKDDKMVLTPNFTMFSGCLRFTRRLNCWIIWHQKWRLRLRW